MRPSHRLASGVATTFNRPSWSQPHDAAPVPITGHGDVGTGTRARDAHGSRDAVVCRRPAAHPRRVRRARGRRDSAAVRVSGLATGDAPAIPYAFASLPGSAAGTGASTVRTAPRCELPQLTWSAWAPLGDGAIGMAGTEAGPELQTVSASGEVHTRAVEHFGLAVSPDDEIVAWLGDHGTPHVVEGAGPRHLTMPRVRHASATQRSGASTPARSRCPRAAGARCSSHRRGSASPTPTASWTAPARC